MLQEGTRLNHTYTLLERLGSGGGGVVYKAYHERLDMYVVVKQVKDRVKGVLNSRAEADILKNLKHTRLPKVYDFFETGGSIFTVMDYIPGESLDKVLRREGRFDQKEVLKWSMQLADALAYLHNQNPPIIHSDIKPANVMLLPNRDVCLIDFNISLVFHEDWKNSVGISNGYSPPEQYRDYASYYRSVSRTTTSGRTETMSFGTDATKTATFLADTEITARTRSLSVKSEYPGSRISNMIGRGIDERSDVYSLGATIYHLLTGQKPEMDFEAVLPIHETNVQVSEGFAIIIEKMMELERSDRYQNGFEVLYALNHIHELDSEYKAFYRRERRRRLLLAALYASGGILMAAGWQTMKRETITSYNRTVETARQFLEADAYEKAEREIRKAMKMIPDRIEAYEKELQRLYALGQYDEAIAYGTDLVNNPQYQVEHDIDRQYMGNIYFIIGNGYFNKENYSESIVYFTRATEQAQENSLYFRDLAIALAKNGYVEDAERTLEEAIRLQLGEDSIYMVQGEIAFAKQEDEQALVYLEQSLNTATTEDLKRRATILYAQTCRRLGDPYLEQEIQILEWAEAEFAANVSMHISEQLADAYARMARTQAEPAKTERYFAKALEKFQMLYDRGYTRRQTMENIAVICHQMERLDEAEKWLNQIVEAYPDDYRAYKRLAFLETDRQQKKANAKRDYWKMKAYSDEAIARYEQSGESDTEMQMLEQMLEELEDGGWL